MPKPRARPHQSGAALLETLISILIFSLGILGLIGLQARAIGLSTDAEDRNRASLLANELASEMWIRKTLTIPDDVKAAWQERVAATTAGGLPGGEGDFTITTTATGPQADIRIEWKPPGRKDDEPASNLTTRVVLP